MIAIPLTLQITSAQGGGAVSLTPPMLSRYTHSISATGGFEGCTLEFACELDEAVFWLAQLMAALVAYGPDGQVIWEGYLNTVSARLGQETISLSMDDCANAVRVRYQPDIGAQVATAFTTDADSISRYGRKELIYSGSGMAAAAATALRDALLDARKEPLARRASSVGGVDEQVSVTLTFEGWWYTLEWLTTSSSTTATAVTTTQVQTLITAFETTNSFFGDLTSNVEASGISDTQYIDEDTPYRTKIEKLLSLGNSSGQRLAYGCYENRAVVVKTWAGANPTRPTYQRALGGGLVYNGAGAEVWPWDVRPDAIYQVNDLLDWALLNGPDVGARYYVERVTCAIDERGPSLKLEPARSGEIDVLLARIR
jgi:hypothetical protein